MRCKFIICVLFSLVYLTGCVHGKNESYDKNAAAETAVKYVNDKYGLEFKPEKWVLPTGYDDIRIFGYIDDLEESYRIDIRYNDEALDYYVIDDYWLFETYTQSYFHHWLNRACKEYVNFNDYIVFGNLYYSHTRENERIVNSMEELTDYYDSGSCKSISFDITFIISEKDYTDDYDYKKSAEGLKKYLTDNFTDCNYSIELCIWRDDRFEELDESDNYIAMSDRNWYVPATDIIVLYEK